MGWENVNGRQCYYIITRVDGTLKRRYGGYGEKGRCAEAEVLRQRTEMRRIRAEGRELESQGILYEKAVKRYIAQSLTNLGYHLSYGRWRLQGRKRGRSSYLKQSMKSTNLIQKSINPPPEIDEAIKSDIHRRALTTFSSDESKLQGILTTIDQMRTELLDENASRMEKVAADQVITAWLQTAVTAYNLEGVIPNGRNARLSAFWENRHHKAQGRLLRSIELLARLKKLKLPSGDSSVIKIVVERTDWPEKSG